MVLYTWHSRVGVIATSPKVFKTMICNLQHSKSKNIGLHVHKSHNTQIFIARITYPGFTKKYDFIHVTQYGSCHRILYSVQDNDLKHAAK